MSAVPSAESSADDKGLIAYHVLRAAVEVFGKQPGELEAAQLQKATERAMKALVLEDRVLGSGVGKRISIPGVAVDQAVEQVQARYEDTTAFEQALLESGVRVVDLRRALWRELMFDAAISTVGDEADPITDKEVEAYFAENPERFRRPEVRTVRHILITINDDYAENTEAEALKRITEIAEHLAAHPDDFQQKAGECSECPSAVEAGLLGDAPRGKLYPELDAALFELCEGEIAGPLQTEAGYHMILCEAIKPAQDLELDQVREKIRQFLNDQRRKALQKAWIDGLA